MKKTIILLIFAFLVTGCQVKYNLTINEDMTITEEAQLTGTNDFFNNYYKTTRKNVLKSLLEIYQDILTENNYEYELIEETLPYVFVKKKYDTVSDYVSKSKLFNGYFDEVKYTEDGKIKRIETIGFHRNDPDNPERFDIKSLQIAIKCPYKVKEHSASRVDTSTNTYYYSLSEENNQILLVYDSSSMYNPNSEFIRTIIICILCIIGVWLAIFYTSRKNNGKKNKNMI